jgi:hypothetical protein
VSSVSYVQKRHFVVAAAVNLSLSLAAFGQPARPPLRGPVGNMTIAPQPASGTAVVFSGKNFTGRSAALPPGEHRVTDFTPASIRVAAGAVVFLYEFVDASGGFGISVDLLEDHADLSEFRMSKVSLISIVASPRPGFFWARGSRANGQYIPGRWERNRAGGNPVNTVAVASPPLPGHLPTGPTVVQQQGTTWTITSLGVQSSADDASWRSASAADGIFGSDFRGAQEIGSAAFERASTNPVIPDWLDFWFPNKQRNDHRSIVYFKRTLRGLITDKLTKNRTEQFFDRDGRLQTISNPYTLSDVPRVERDRERAYVENDLNVDIQPFADYQYLIKDSHEPERSIKETLKNLVDDSHDPCTDPFFNVEAEVEARDGAMDTLVQQLLPRVGKPISVYGPWVFDVGHCSHPEIHPAEEIWWTDRTPDNRDVYHLNVFADASGRFWFRSQMDGDRKLRPWAAPPLTGLYAIAFEVGIDGIAATTFRTQQFEVATVDALNVAHVPGGNTAHTLVLNGRTLVSFVPHSDAFKVSYENVGLKPGAGNVVRGFLVIETTVGKVTQTATKITLNLGNNQTVTVNVPPGTDPDKIEERLERQVFRKEAGHIVFTVTRTAVADGLVAK